MNQFLCYAICSLRWYAADMAAKISVQAFIIKLKNLFVASTILKYVTVFSAFIQYVLQDCTKHTA